MQEFVKFPSTPHLAVLDGVSVRNDKVLSLSERECFLAHNVTVEEKIDGANLGISFDGEGRLRAQNRGNVLRPPMTGQWKALPEWMVRRSGHFWDVLSDRYILFGEWCYAKHSVFYDQLPDWFVGFDVFDSEADRFVCKETRDDFLANLELTVVPCVARGRLTFKEIIEHLGKSQYGEAPMEGLYLRYDEGDWLGQRAKLVRRDFMQSIEQHWSRGMLEVNRLMAPKESHR